MKRILLIICMALFSNSILAQNSFKENNATIEAFFEKYRDTKNITTIEIGPAMVKILAAGMVISGEDDKEAMDLLRSIKSIDIMVENQEGMSHITGEMFELAKLCKGFELISSISQEGEVCRFYFASHDDSDICEFLMLVRQADQRVLMYITGGFSVSDISALGAMGGNIL
ncbi:MAG: DUF4252 domain-containing protein [Rikenellaceae bacterium]